MNLNNYNQALRDYERRLNEPPLSEEERLEQYQTKEDYLETQAEYMLEEIR